MYGASFNIGHMEYGSEIYGPGKRTVIWFQGCSLGCKGCWNTQYQSKDPSVLILRDDLLKTIMSKNCGVTFLGGEPLQQIDNLEWLMKELKKRSVHVVLYTGYELEEIESDPQKQRVCSLADVLIPGRYVEEVRDTNLLWRGSRNQPLIFQGHEETVKDENQVEITIGTRGEVICLGYPSKEISSFIRNLDGC